MRIRTIKPEFWENEELAQLSPDCQLLAIGLLNHADDEGYFNANTRLIKAKIFPLRDPKKTIIDMLNELDGCYIRQCFGSDGKPYGFVLNFKKHQRIDRPKPSKIKDLCTIDDESTIDRRRIDEGSTLEGKGREQGKEQGVSKKSKPSKSHSDDKSPVSPVVEKSNAIEQIDPLADHPDLSELFDRLIDWIEREHPHAKTVPKPRSKRWREWRDTLLALVEKDDYRALDVIGAMEWVFEIEEAREGWPGWKKQIQSIGSLRTRKTADQLTKFGKVYSAWQNSTNGETQPTLGINEKWAKTDTSKLPGFIG